MTEHRKRVTRALAVGLMLLCALPLTPLIVLLTCCASLSDVLYRLGR